MRSRASKAPTLVTRREPTAEQWVRINAIKDSLRKIYPPRLDSISNGADDDGSGSVSILEIARGVCTGTRQAEAVADLHLADG